MQVSLPEFVFVLALQRKSEFSKKDVMRCGVDPGQIAYLSACSHACYLFSGTSCLVSAVDCPCAANLAALKWYCAPEQQKLNVPSLVRLHDHDCPLQRF